MASQRIKGITITIGGDTSDLVKALKSADDAARTTKYNLNDINKALKFDPTNVNLLKDKQRELSDAVKTAKEKLDTEKEALEQLKNTEGFDANSKAAKDLQTQIDLDTVALQQAEKALKDFGSVGSQQLQAVGKQLEEVGNKLKTVGDNIANVGRDITTKVSVPIATALGSAIKVTADFDSQMSKVKAISGATGDEFEQLRDKARDMGATTKYSATEAGQAFEYMGMAGWKTEDMLNGINGIMNLAAASGEELGTTSDIVTDALTAFGLSAQDSARFADILAAASTNANTNVSMMGESFKYVAPVAGSLGYSAEDVAVALGLMANSGIKADMAGTSLRNMFQRLAKPTKESYNAMVQLGLSIADSEGNAYSFREIMDQIRTSFAGVNVDLNEYNNSLNHLDSMLQEGQISQEEYDELLNKINVDLLGTAGSEKARYAAMLGGTRAMSGLLAIANATEEDYQKLTAAIDNSSDSFARLADGSVVPLNEALESGAEIVETYTGQAEAMAKTMEDNLGGDITVLKSALQELAISFGDLMMPALRQIVEKVQSLVDWLNSLDEGTKNTIIQIALVVAAIGPVILIIGKIVGAIGTIISAVGAVTSAIGVIMPILTAIGTLITGTIIPAIAAIGAPILVIVGVIGVLIAIIVQVIKHWDEIKEATEKAIEAMGEAWDKFKENFTETWNKMKENLAKKVDEMKQKWEQFKNNVSQIWNNLKTSLSNAASAMKSNITNAFSNIFSAVVSKVTGIKDNALNAFNNLRNGISSVIGNIYNTIVNGFGNAVSYITSLPSRAVGWGRDIINGVVDGIYNAFHNLVSAVSDIASTIADYIGFSEPDKGELSDFHTFMPDMIRLMTQGIESSLPMLENAMDNMSRSMIPTMGGAEVGTSNTSNSVSINVYGAQGQDVNELARIIENKITDNVVRRGVAFG